MCEELRNTLCISKWCIFQGYLSTIKKICHVLFVKRLGSQIIRHLVGIGMETSINPPYSTPLRHGYTLSLLTSSR